MAIAGYFAMTASEYRCCPRPEGVAWMACHFSPYGTGLTNLPTELAAGAMLMLNDRTPMQGHDPEHIIQQLTDALTRWDCAGLVLDFQQPGNPQAAQLASLLAEQLPAPVGVSSLYAGDGKCPVFLTPVPLDTPLSAYLAPWQGREIWLDTALDAQKLTLTPSGLTTAPAPALPEGFSEETLHCHYAIHQEEEQVSFSLWRTADDLHALLKEADTLGVTRYLGLYQEFFPHAEGLL